MAQFEDISKDLTASQNQEIGRKNSGEFARRERRDSEYSCLTDREKYSVYPKMSFGRGYEIIVHSFKHTRIGYFNLEFRRKGKRDCWLGANINERNYLSIKGLESGLFNETAKSIYKINKNPHFHKATVLNVSKAEYDKALGTARERFRDKNQCYDILGIAKHCIHFMDSVLKNVGIYGKKGKTLGEMAIGNTFVAKLARRHYSRLGFR